MNRQDNRYTHWIGKTIGTIEIDTDTDTDISHYTDVDRFSEGLMGSIAHLGC